MKTAQQLAKEASEALSNLNTYGAVIALCESSLFLAGRDRLSMKIAKMCHAEIQKELRLYDKAMNALVTYNARVKRRRAQRGKPREAGPSA